MPLEASLSGQDIAQVKVLRVGQTKQVVLQSEGQQQQTHAQEHEQVWGGKNEKRDKGWSIKS